MARPAPTQPTDGELEILNILWRRGSSSLREIHEIIQANRKLGLTTTLKTLQIMTRKALVIRDTSVSPSRYTAAVPQAAAQAGLMKDLVRKAFDGSARMLMIRAVEEGGLSDEQLREVRKLIDQVRREKRGERQ